MVFALHSGPGCARLSFLLLSALCFLGLLRGKPGGHVRHVPSGQVRHVRQVPSSQVPEDQCLSVADAANAGEGARLFGGSLNLSQLNDTQRNANSEHMQCIGCLGLPVSPQTISQLPVQGFDDPQNTQLPPARQPLWGTPQRRHISAKGLSPQSWDHLPKAFGAFVSGTMAHATQMTAGF